MEAIMSSQIIEIKGKKKSTFKDHVMGLLPEGGNLNLCLRKKLKTLIE